MWIERTRENTYYRGGFIGGPLPLQTGMFGRGIVPPSPSVTACTFGLCWPTWDLYSLFHV